jgi:lysozyme family protein
MVQDFEGALKFVLEAEGGYTNDPGDPGGATNFGITQATYNAWLKATGQPLASVETISMAQYEAIYKTQYWDAMHGDYTPGPISYALFDTAVNSGQGRAIQFLQSALDIPVTFAFDQPTSLAFHIYIGQHPAHQLAGAILDRRLAWDQSLTTERKFLPGWEARINRLKTVIANLS